MQQLLRNVASTKRSDVTHSKNMMSVNASSYAGHDIYLDSILYPVGNEK